MKSHFVQIYFTVNIPDAIIKSGHRNSGIIIVNGIAVRNVSDCGDWRPKVDRKKPA